MDASKKTMLRVIPSRYWQRYNTFAIGEIKQYRHQNACIYIAARQLKWRHTNVKKEGGNSKFYLEDSKLTKTINNFKEN